MENAKSPIFPANCTNTIFVIPISWDQSSRPNCDIEKLRCIENNVSCMPFIVILLWYPYLVRLGINQSSPEDEVNDFLSTSIDARSVDRYVCTVAIFPACTAGHYVKLKNADVLMSTAKRTWCSLVPGRRLLFGPYV